jgi:hypothetical protein
MTKNYLLESDPLVLDATLTDDALDLVLTKEGYETMEEMLEMMRETNPKATYNDLLKLMLRTLIETLEAELN